MKILTSTSTPEYRASCDRALADLIAFRRQYGFNEDPFASTLIVQPSAVLVMRDQVEQAERRAR